MDLAFADDDVAVEVVGDLSQDLRRRTLWEIAVRRGQGRFRSDLLVAYGRCAVTGTATASVLEAAHISPYRGEHTNVLQNGLLLRADIHTLFDVNLLTVVHIEDDYVVRVAPELNDSTYDSLDGEALMLPVKRRDWPDPGVLKQHNDECRWYASMSGATRS